MARQTKAQIAERDEAREQLRAKLPPGSTVNTILRRVSSSGMCRHISVAIVEDGEVSDITWQVARAMGETFQRDTGGIKVGGCGMDMGFHLVYSLSRGLYPDGFAPSDHAIRPDDGKSVNVNIGRGRNAGPMTEREIAELSSKGRRFTGGRNGDTSGWDNDGGYALKQRWL